jgi:hypothetical protein
MATPKQTDPTKVPGIPADPRGTSPQRNGLLATTAAPSTTAVPSVPDYSVATKVSEITAKNSPLMQQARTAGVQYANKRGLLNSSLAGEAAQEAVIKTATPIASQDSQQEHALHLAGLNLAANDRDKATAAAVSFENTYASMFQNIASNEALPAAIRDKYIQHIGKLRDSNMALIEMLYGVDLEWASPTP